MSSFWAEICFNFTNIFYIDKFFIFEDSETTDMSYLLFFDIDLAIFERYGAPVVPRALKLLLCFLFNKSSKKKGPKIQIFIFLYLIFTKTIYIKLILSY